VLNWFPSLIQVRNKNSVRFQKMTATNLLIFGAPIIKLGFGVPDLEAKSSNPGDLGVGQKESRCDSGKILSEAEMLTD
jgi:hypothetical protein